MLEILGALLFEDDFSLTGGLFFLTEGAGYVAEGRGSGIGRAEFPERAFALGVSVGSAAHERSLGGQGMLFGMQSVTGRLNDLRLVGKNGDSGLSEGGRGTKNKENNQRSFHRCFGPEFHSGMVQPRYQPKGLRIL